MKFILAATVTCLGCTTLGPMPATTGISAVPAARPGGEIQGAIIPAFYLSDSASSPDNNHNAPQLAALFEPDKLFHAPGLVLGARTWGNSHDSLAEPFIGYRQRFDPKLAGAFVAYGTKSNAGQNGASYRASRLGGELMVDATMFDITSWLAVHGQVAAQLTAISAQGTYCVDDVGVGKDCSDTEPNRTVNGDLVGLYPAATGTLAVDFARRATGVFHGARLALLVAAGRMPKLVEGRQKLGDEYASLGLTLTLGFGSDTP